MKPVTLMTLVTSAFLACGENENPSLADPPKFPPVQGQENVTLEADHCDTYVMSEAKRKEFWAETSYNMLKSGAQECHTDNCNVIAQADLYSGIIYGTGTLDYIGNVSYLKSSGGVTRGFNAFATPVGYIVTHRDMIDGAKMGTIAYLARKHCAVFDLWDSWSTTIDEAVAGVSDFSQLTKPPGYNCVMSNHIGEIRQLFASAVIGAVSNHEVMHIDKQHSDKRYCLWLEDRLTYNTIKAQEREADVGASDGIINVQCPPSTYGTSACFFDPVGQLLVLDMIASWEGQIPETDSQTHPPGWIRRKEAEERFRVHAEYAPGLDEYNAITTPTMSAHFASEKVKGQLIDTECLPLMDSRAKLILPR